MTESLESRFKLFMKSVAFSESIDEILRRSTTEDRKRADYLLFERTAIAELKSLSEDPSAKVDAELDKHKYRTDYPLACGQISLQSILQTLPDGEEINRDIFFKITRQIKSMIRDANQQIASTKEIFQIPDSVGFLILLNEKLEIFSPDIILYRASQYIGHSKSPNYQNNINFVWLISESHTAKVLQFRDVRPSILLTGSGAEKHKWFPLLFEKLQLAWANFNDYPLIRVKTLNPESISLVPTPQKDQT